jgi:hypothetical protein
MAVKVPAFHRPSAKLARRILPGRAVANGGAVARMRRRGMSPREIASALVWLETARYYGISQVLDIEGHESPVTELLTTGTPGPSRRAGATAPALTGALIATNEASRIAGALESLAGFVDEIVILDGGSTDETVEIAKSYGATVHHRAFDRDFAAQRNALLDHVRTPWVFMLDCDERVPQELATDVVDVLRGTEVDAVVLPWLNLVDDDPVPTRWPDPHARVHRTRLRYRSPVHEYVLARTAIYLPLNGPCVQHHKTKARSYRQLRLYDAIDPGQTTQIDIERMARWKDADPAGE